MNRIQRASLVALLLASFGAAFALPSVASTASTPRESKIRIIDQGKTANGGWVKFTGTGTIKSGSSSSRSFFARATENVGGGTWYFGSGLNSAGQKSCFSQYYHAKVKHGSSVSMDGYYHADHNVAKGKTSYARITRHTTATCKAFYTKN